MQVKLTSADTTLQTQTNSTGLCHFALLIDNIFFIFHSPQQRVDALSTALLSNILVSSSDTAYHHFKKNLTSFLPNHICRSSTENFDTKFSTTLKKIAVIQLGVPTLVFQLPINYSKLMCMKWNNFWCITGSYRAKSLEEG